MSMELENNGPVAATDPAPEKAPEVEPVEAAKPDEPKKDTDAAAANAAPPSKTKDEPTDEDIKALPLRQYLEHTVVGVLMQGMQQICRKRPDDPVAFMADFLIRNNPKKRKAEEAAGGADDAPKKDVTEATEQTEKTEAQAVAATAM
jgi:protein dpy-30